MSEKYSIEVEPLSVDPLEDPRVVRELAQRYFVFDAFVGGERRVDLHPLVLSEELHARAVSTAEGVVRAVKQIAERAHVDPIERAHYRFSEDTLRLADASWRANDDALFSRVDLLLGTNGHWHACEINADCPGGHNEAFGLPRLARAAGYTRGANPTVAVRMLVDCLMHLARGGVVGLLYATAYAEDLQVCALVQRMLEERGVRAILAPPTAPRLKDGALVIGSQRIDALYRFFPTEWMSGQRNIDDIAKAIELGVVRTVSSFAHMFLQSKGAFARAWNHRDSLSAVDCEVIESSIPETHDLLAVPSDVLLAAPKEWVVKCTMGRVGDQVYVGHLCAREEWRALLAEARQRANEGEAWIAQRFVPQAQVRTPWGPRYVTLGAYVVNGTFAGYFARVTPETHVSHDALCVPVFTERMREDNVAALKATG